MFGNIAAARSISSSVGIWVDRLDSILRLLICDRCVFVIYSFSFLGPIFGWSPIVKPESRTRCDHCIEVITLFTSVLLQAIEGTAVHAARMPHGLRSGRTLLIPQERQAYRAIDTGYVIRCGKRIDGLKTPKTGRRQITPLGTRLTFVQPADAATKSANAAGGGGFPHDRMNFQHGRSPLVRFRLIALSPPRVAE